MQRVKGAVFFQLASSAAGTAIKISRLQPERSLLSLPFMQKAPCVYACPPHLPDFSRSCFAWAAAERASERSRRGFRDYALFSLCVRARYLHRLWVIRVASCCNPGATCYSLSSGNRWQADCACRCPRFRAHFFRFFRAELARQLWDLPQLDCYRECCSFAPLSGTLLQVHSLLSRSP